MMKIQLREGALVPISTESPSSEKTIGSALPTMHSTRKAYGALGSPHTEGSPGFSRLGCTHISCLCRTCTPVAISRTTTVRSCLHLLDSTKARALVTSDR